MFRDRRVLVVLNPASGRAEPASLVGPLKRELAAAGASAAEVRLTAAFEDAVRWGRDATAEGFGLVLVAGGDGTVAAVAGGVMQGGGRPPIGILPVGTGNGLARALRLPAEPLRALGALAAGRLTEVDVLEVTSHGRISLVFVGAGLDAEINRDALASHKRRFGTLAYVAATARNLVGRRNHRVRLTLDGRLEIVSAHAVSVFNAGMIEIAGMEFGPPADPRDGRLDVAVFRSPGFFVATGQVLRLMRGRPRRAEWLRAARMRVEADPPMLVHADGEVVGHTPLEAVVRARALTFVADESYPSSAAFAP